MTGFQPQVGFSSAAFPDIPLSLHSELTARSRTGVMLHMAIDLEQALERALARLESHGSVPDDWLQQSFPDCWIEVST